MKKLFSFFNSSQPEKADQPDAPLLPPIIGLEAVGRGIRLKPHQASEMKGFCLADKTAAEPFNPEKPGKPIWCPAAMK